MHDASAKPVAGSGDAYVISESSKACRCIGLYTAHACQQWQLRLERMFGVSFGACDEVVPRMVSGHCLVSSGKMWTDAVIYSCACEHRFTARFRC